MALSIIGFLLSSAVGLTVQQSLSSVLMSRTAERLRPVADPSSQVTVHILGALYQIVDVDQRNNLATINAYFDMWWVDEFLRWDPKEFNGTYNTYLPSGKVWVPELYLYHSIQGSTPLFLHDAAVQVHYTGKIRIFVPFTARALCPINVKYFPFDKQEFNLTFGSWSYKLENVAYKVESEQVFLQDFYDNQEWILISSTLIDKTVQYYTVQHNETYSAVIMTLRMERQSFYYIFNLLIPTTLVSLVALIGFHAPGSSSPRRETKFRLGIMTLLSMGVMLLMVVDEMPKFSLSSTPGQRGSFSDVPLLGIYYIFLICAISLATCTTSVFVLIERWALENPGRRPPQLTRWVGGEIPPLSSLFPSRQKSQEKPSILVQPEPKNSAGLDRQLRFGAEPLAVQRSPLIPRLEALSRRSSASPPPPPREAQSELQAGLRRLSQLLETLVQEHRPRPSESCGGTLSVEWATWIHRLELSSLIFYLGAIFTALLAFFFPGWY